MIAQEARSADAATVRPVSGALATSSSSGDQCHPSARGPEEPSTGLEAGQPGDRRRGRTESTIETAGARNSTQSRLST